MNAPTNIEHLLPGLDHQHLDALDEARAEGLKRSAERLLDIGPLQAVDAQPGATVHAGADIDAIRRCIACRTR